MNTTNLAGFMSALSMIKSWSALKHVEVSVRFKIYFFRILQLLLSSAFLDFIQHR